jgi:hypothetical protein
MLDKLFLMFKTDAVNKITFTTQMVGSVMKLIETEFAGDDTSKNAAIDSLIAMLQSQKIKKADGTEA